MDDKTIVATLQSHEEQGYQLLMDGYIRYVTAILSGMVKDSLPVEDIEEMAADVFFRIWEQRNRLKWQSLKYYIAQTARNIAIDRLRKNNIEPIPYEDDVISILNSNSTDDLVELRQQKELMENAVETFHKSDREIFIRYYYFGETIRQISNHLELKEATTKTKLHRSRAKIKDLFIERGYHFE